MAGVIVFLDKTDVPNNLTEIHFFEDDLELIRYSTAHLDRKHLVRAVNGEYWHRTPGPATRTLLEYAKTITETAREMDQGQGFKPDVLKMVEDMEAFLAEWAEPDMQPASEQPAPSSPYLCAICGKPVRIGDDLQPYHLVPIRFFANHKAELSEADRKTLADGLGLRPTD